MTMATPRPCFSVSTGSARSVSIISPKALVATRAEMNSVLEFRGDQ